MQTDAYAVRINSSAPDAWEGSRDIAKAKAYPAMAFSSNENALTTRTIFCATQPGGPLCQIGNSNQAGLPLAAGSINPLGIIQFPGGVPIYKNCLSAGGFGVSGDSIPLDEQTAFAGAGDTYGAADSIKSTNNPPGVSYKIGDGGWCSASLKTRVNFEAEGRPKGCPSGMNRHARLTNSSRSAASASVESSTAVRDQLAAAAADVVYRSHRRTE